MKNKLFNKFLSVLLVSFIGLTSISSFNHVSAQELDNFSYTNQLVSSGNSLNKDLWGHPQLPPPNDPKLKPYWMGAVAYLVAMFSVKVNSPSNHTFNVLQNGLSDNSTSIFINNTLNNSPNFNMNDFANDPDVINGNFDSVYNKYSSKINVDKNGFINLENHNKNLYYDGGNKNYYTNNDYSSVNNYKVYNNTTNHINYTYNNQHYNYTTNNSYYNYTNNTYIYNIVNNQNISISNTYNNTTIISPSGQTQKLYYVLPDGSNSLNLTEEQAKKGYKTSLNVASYSNGYDDDNLNFLFHFDGNEYDSAYPIVNYTLKAIPNSVDYIDSSNPSFNQAIAFSDSFDLSVEGSNYNNFYSFRIYPQINDNWSLNINGVNIASVTSKYDTSSTFEEYSSFAEAPSTKLYVVPMKDNYYLYYSRSNGYDRFFVTADFSGLIPTDFNNIFSISPLSRPSSDYTNLLGNSMSVVSSWGKNEIGFYDNVIPFYRVSSDSCFYSSSSHGFIPGWSLQHFINNGFFGDGSTITGVYPYGGKKTKLYQNYSSVSVSNFRQYNFINNKTFLQSGSNLLNYNQWNFISIDTSGKVFINGVDTNISVPLDQFKISVTGDSLTYIDELASFKTNRSNTSPSIPYDSNVSYYLPPVYYDVKNVKKSEIKNNMLLIQSLTPINSSKFGGIRPSNPSTGDVYCSVNENGNITSVQQYNGIEWVKVVGSIYNDALGLWVNAVGFNIFLDNWSYQDIDFRADNPDTNILIRFLTSQFNKVTSLLDSIIEKIKGISSEDTVINNYQNNYNVDINTNIDNLINTSKDYDKDIDLNSPSYNVDDSILTDINNLAVGSKGIFKALDDSGFSILYLAPLILLLVGLLL